MRLILIIFFMVISSFAIFSQEKVGSENYLHQFYLVELIRVIDRPVLDSITIARIQKAHLNNIDSLHHAGKLVLAGPFGDEKGGGIFVLKTDTIEEAIKLTENDPAVKNGRLYFRVRPWWSDRRMFTSERE